MAVVELVWRAHPEAIAIHDFSHKGACPLEAPVEDGRETSGLVIRLCVAARFRVAAGDCMRWLAGIEPGATRL